MNRETRAAIKAAKAAGKIALKHFGKPIKHKTKSSRFDWVTKADIESEKEIIRILSREFPGSGFIAEESGKKKGNDYTWIIDPIDGTNNFASGIPYFNTAIALAKKGELQCSVVFDPTRKDLFHAEKGKGAFLNGKKIRVSRRRKLHEFTVISSMRSGLKKQESWRIKQKRFADLYKSVRSIRMFGSSELDLSYIAAGRIEAFTGYNTLPWDAAAGVLMIREAGGRVSNESGKDWAIGDRVLVASNSTRHKELLGILGF